MKPMAAVQTSVLLLLSLFFPFIPLAQEKRILYIAKYHTAKGEWTAGIKSGIDSVVSTRQDIVLKTRNTDTRLVKSKKEKSKAAKLA